MGKQKGIEMKRKTNDDLYDLFMSGLINI